jgi:predicted phosphodiesterase
LRYAILSDAHGNWEALQSVLQDIEYEGADKIVFLGDLVGYGPDPNIVVEELTAKADINLAGNHDWAAVGRIDITYFNPYAKIAILMTRKLLTVSNLKKLTKLKLIAKDTEERLLFVHSTPREPEKWHYISTLEDAEENFSALTERVCFIGHSHYPLFIEKNGEGTPAVKPVHLIKIEQGCQYIINVGSIGQPRDGDPRACYAIYDSSSKTVQLKKIFYDVVKVQEKMQALGLPPFLIDRLAIGR